MVNKLEIDGLEVVVMCGNETGESNQIEEEREEKGREYWEGQLKLRVIWGVKKKPNTVEVS